MIGSECPLVPVPLHGVGEDYPWQVEALRWIRNICRHGFSHHTGRLSGADQQAWWAGNHDAVVGAIYYRSGELHLALDLVGFGAKYYGDKDRTHMVTSVAVLPSQGGHGYGGAITAHLIRMQPHVECRASARKDNPAAQALHRGEDWEVTHEDQCLVHYRTRPDIWERPQRECRA